MNKKKLIFFLLVVVLAVVALITLTSSSKVNTNLFRVISSEARLETAKNALLIIQKNPVFGVGFNSYRYAQYKYGFSNEINLSSHADAGTDNSLLFIIATTGIIGFFLYLFLWFRIYKISSILAIASVAGVFVDSMFINSLFYPFIIFWLYVVISTEEFAKPGHSLTNR